MLVVAISMMTEQLDLVHAPVLDQGAECNRYRNSSTDPSNAIPPFARHLETTACSHIIPARLAGLDCLSLPLGVMPSAGAAASSAI